MKTVFYTNGELGDPYGTGLTVARYIQNDAGEFVAVPRDVDGNPALGYMPKEVTEAEYQMWEGRIKTPDFVTYFPGMFPGGVVNKPVYDGIQLSYTQSQASAQTATAAQVNMAFVEFGVDERVEDAIAKVVADAEAEASGGGDDDIKHNSALVKQSLSYAEDYEANDGANGNSGPPGNQLKKYAEAQGTAYITAAYKVIRETDGGQKDTTASKKDTTASKKAGKRMQARFDKTAVWSYTDVGFTSLLDKLGVDKGEFFAKAKSL